MVPRSCGIRPLGCLRKMFIDLQITALSAQEGPDEGTEFASDGDNDLVAHEAALRPTARSGSGAVLCLPAHGRSIRQTFEHNNQRMETEFKECIGLGSTRKLVTVYIAGPRRGYPRYNFDEFYRAEADLLAMGFNPINPARIDEEQGFDPDDAQQIIPPSMVQEFVWRNIELIIQADGLCLLPGWDRSVGATAEYWLARGLSKRIFILNARVLINTPTA